MMANVFFCVCVCGILQSSCVFVVECGELRG